MKLFPSDIARQRVVEFLKEHGPATLEEIASGLPDELPARVKNAVQVLYYGSYVIAWRKKVTATYTSLGRLRRRSLLAHPRNLTKINPHIQKRILTWLER